MSEHIAPSRVVLAGTDVPEHASDGCRNESASVGPATATDGEATDTEADSEPFVLVAMDDYRPGLRFELMERLPAPISVAMLTSPVGEQPSVLSRPDEYVGYVGRSVFDSGQVRGFTTVFSRRSLETEGRYAFGRDAGVFSVELHLLRATVRRSGSDAGESLPV